MPPSHANTACRLTDRPDPVLSDTTPGTWPILSRRSQAASSFRSGTSVSPLRESMPDVEIKLIDCPVQKMVGVAPNPDARVAAEHGRCAGDRSHLRPRSRQTLSNREAHIAQVHHGGGFTLPHVPEWALGPGASDFLVFGEGQLTFAEAVKTLRYGGDLNEVKGLRFLGKGEVVDTGFRPLIHDLDSLPMPAYDLMPRISHRSSASFRTASTSRRGRLHRHGMRHLDR